MRLVLLSSLVLGLFVVTGCGAGAHSRPLVIDRSDPSWNPPDEVRFTTSNEPKAYRSTAMAGALPTPNRGEVVRGQVHAAY